MKTLLLRLWVVGLSSATLTANAGTNGFIVPFFRGSPMSEAGYWESFSIPVGPPGNRPDRPGATSDAILTQTRPGAILTGTGNIYNLDAASAFVLSASTAFTLGTVVLQARTLGGELDYDAVSLSYLDGAGLHSLAPATRVELDRGSVPGLGSTVSSLWQWELKGLRVGSYSITFHALKASLSFDSITLDTSSEFVSLFSPTFKLSDTRPVIERWMYAHNAAPCDRPAGGVFGTFGDAAGVDTRHAQHLLGWNTDPLAPTNRGPANYLVRRCRVTLTVNRGDLFAYDPTEDSFRTYFETNHPAYQPDADAGRPIELFGVGYRNGFDEASFEQCSLFGTNAPAQRNAYAAGWSRNGAWVDVSNNVGKTNAAFPRFEVAPFALGQTTNAAPGELVGTGAKISFDLNLEDPFVLSYVQSSLHTGRLRFMVTSLHTSGGQFGTPAYPDFATHFSAAVVDPTRLELEGLVAGNADLDADGLPDDWELFYLKTLAYGRTTDSDGDGASNFAESRARTDPLNALSVLRLSLARDEAGQVQLRFPHIASRRHTVEFTEDFQTWRGMTKLPVYSLRDGQVEWVDEGAAASKRFYRLHSEEAAP